MVQQKEKLKNAALRCINNFQLQPVYTKPKKYLNYTSIQSIDNITSSFKFLITYSFNSIA